MNQTSHSQKLLASPKKKKMSRKKLKPIQKVKSFPARDGNSAIDDSKDRLTMNLEERDDNDSLSVSVITPGRLQSTRSYGSSLDGSEYTNSSRLLTQRELVQEIKYRAEKHLNPPPFVTPFEELPPTVLSWDHKLSKKSWKQQINIIGCLQPMELVLAQADQRLRHQQETMDARQKICEEKVKQIDDAIQLKFTRAERYKAALEAKQRQITWIKVIKLSIYLKQLHEETHRHVQSGQFFSKTVHAAYVIRQACTRFMRRHLYHKFKYKFMVLFRKREFLFRLGMRIKRKKNAVLRIKTFLTEYKNHHRMNVVVHKYLMGVRKVQRNMRDFIACKHAKINVLGVLWAKMERNYVKHMLEKRKLAKRNTGKLKGNGEDFSDVDPKALIDMKNQAKLWDRIDSKMEDRVKALKAAGVIACEDEEELADRYMLPAKRRWAALLDLLQFLRKEFYQSQRAVIRRKLDSEAAFSENHALDLLRGRNADIVRIVLEKFDKRLVSLRYKPFMLFSSVSHKLIMERIMQAHTINETFALKISDFSNYSTKVNSRNRKISKERALEAAAERAAKAAASSIQEELEDLNLG